MIKTPVSIFPSYFESCQQNYIVPLYHCSIISSCYILGNNLLVAEIATEWVWTSPVLPGGWPGPATTCKLSQQLFCATQYKSILSPWPDNRMDGSLCPQNAHKLSVFQHSFIFGSYFCLFPRSRLYSSLSLSTFQGLLMIARLANSLFSFWYLLHPDLSNLNSISVYFCQSLPPCPCISLDTFLLFLLFFSFLDTSLHIWCPSLICLGLVFQSPTSKFTFSAIAVPVAYCLYFSVHAERRFHFVSFGAMSISRILKD